MEIAELIVSIVTIILVINFEMSFDFKLDAFDFKNMCIFLLLTLSSLPRSFFDLNFHRTNESQNEPG